MSTAYAWTGYGTVLALLPAAVGLMFDVVLRVETRLEARIGELGRDLRSEMRELRSEMHEGFAQMDDRLRLLERDRP